MSTSRPSLFSPLTLRGVTARNRAWISPMCQYSVTAEDGVATPWHLVHLGSRAVGGAGLVVVEATAVEPRGRISARDLGLWNDAQAEALAPIAGFLAEHGAVPAIQLAHAGRKAGVPGAVAPSAVAYSHEFPVPRALERAEMPAVVRAFAEAAGRAREAGFQAVEIHAAHGYLLHEFLSPVSNRRDDDFGGGFDGRVRLLVDVVAAVRACWPERLPLFVRVSATDWIEGGWDLPQTVSLASRLAALGVDLVDCSSGGVSPDQRIDARPGYQVPFAATVRREAGVSTGAVGLITTPEQADEIVRTEQADAVLIGRESLRDPYWPLRAARALDQSLPAPYQYERVW